MEAKLAGGAQDPPVGPAGEGQLSAPFGPLGQLACPALPCPPAPHPASHLHIPEQKDPGQLTLDPRPTQDP